MLFMRKTTALPSAAEALPGRADPIPTATRHFVNGNPLAPPYPAGLERAVFGARLLLGRRAQVLGDWATASTRPRWVTRAATPRTRPMRRSAPAGPATPRWCWWCSIRRLSRTTKC